MYKYLLLLLTLAFNAFSHGSHAHSHPCGLLLEKLFIAEKARITLPADSAIKSVSALSERVSDKDMKIITSIIKEINKGILAFTKVVKQVQRLHVKVEKTDSNAYFMGFDQQVLYTVRQMAMPVKEADGSLKFFTEHPIKTRPVTAHEFGHGVVNRTMYDLVPEYKQFVDALVPLVSKQVELEEMATKGQALEKEVSARIKDLYPGKTLDDIEIEVVMKDHPDLFEQIQELQELIQVFLAKRKELQEMSGEAMKKAGVWQSVADAFGAHNEFFADVIGIVYAKSKPDAISDALSNTRHYQLDHDLSEVRASNRNFDHRNNRIDRWKPDPSIHNRFAPTRYHVWHNYLKQPTHTRPKIQAQILDNIMRAIIKDMRWRMDNGGVGRSPVEDNKVLIQFIDEMFEKYPIDYSVIDSPMF